MIQSRLSDKILRRPRILLSIPPPHTAAKSPFSFAEFNPALAALSSDAVKMMFTTQPFRAWHAASSKARICAPPKGSAGTICSTRISSAKDQAFHSTVMLTGFSVGAAAGCVASLYFVQRRPNALGGVSENMPRTTKHAAESPHYPGSSLKVARRHFQ